MAPNKCVILEPSDDTKALFRACECPRGELLTIAYNPFNHKLVVCYQDYPDAILAAEFACRVVASLFADMGFSGLESNIKLPKVKELY